MFSFNLMCWMLVNKKHWFDIYVWVGRTGCLFKQHNAKNLRNRVLKFPWKCFGSDVEVFVNFCVYSVFIFFWGHFRHHLILSQTHKDHTSNNVIAYGKNQDIDGEVALLCPLSCRFDVATASFMQVWCSNSLFHAGLI